MVRSEPPQEQEEGKHGRRGASRALASSAHLQAAPAGPAAALEEKGAESAWCQEGEDEIKIWDHGKAQVSLLAFHSLLGRNNSLIPAALGTPFAPKHEFSRHKPLAAPCPSPRLVPPGCQRLGLCKEQGKAEFQPFTSLGLSPSSLSPQR